MQTEHYATAIIASLIFWTGPVIGTEENVVATESFTPYTAKYSASRSGATLAEAVFTLSRSEQGWEYHSHARPRGFATLFTNQEIRETSLLDLHQYPVQPLHYQYNQGTPKGKSKEYLEILYNWQTGDAKITHQTESKQVAISAGTYDPLSVQLALMQHTKKGFEFVEYAVFDEMKIEQRKFERTGTESIKTALGSYETIRISYRHGKRETITWLAPALHYIPVRIQQFKDNKLKSEMLIQSATFGEPASTD